MSRRTIGIIILVVGILIILGSLGAGYIGLSASTVIGTKKIIGAVVGLVIAIIGVTQVGAK